MNTKWTVKWICTIAFLDLFAVSLAFPLLSAHMRSLGASHFTSGLISSLYAALQLLSGPIIGSWSDLRGRRSILLVTLPVCALGYAFLGIGTTLTVVVIARIVLGLAKHTQTLSRALVSDIVSGPRQTEVNGTMSAVSSAGFIVGPIIGGHLTELDNGFRYVCFLVAALFCINFAIAYAFIRLREPSSHKTKAKGVSVKTEFVRAVTDLGNINWPRYWDVFTLKFLLGFTMAVFFTEYSISIQDRFQIMPKWVGYTISFQGLVGSAAGMSINYVDKIYDEKKNRNIQILHGFLVMATSFICLSFAPNIITFVLCLVPISTCTSLLRIVTTETMLRRTSVNKQGTLIGTSGSIMSIGRLLAPMCAGLVRDMFGTDGISALTVVTAGMGTCIAALVYYQNRNGKAKIL